MNHCKLHIPSGVQDILPDECYNKKVLEKKVREIFDSWSYLEVEPSSFEYLDVFSSSSPSIEQGRMFKFFEPDGHTLILRPDFTTPIARIVSTKFKKEYLPIRLSYIGNIYRYEKQDSDRQREIAQAGVELMGVKGPEADAEVIAIAIETMESIGLTNFQIDIGQIDFTKGFIEQCNLKEDDAQKLTTLIDNKDILELEAFLDELKISCDFKELFKELPLLYGGSKILDRAAKIANNQKSKSAVENLYDVYEILKDYGLSEYITFDLGMIHNINYYTGIIFKGMTDNLGYPICAGGRYDRLVSEFGYDIAATGFALELKKILIALEKQNSLSFRPGVDVLVVFGRENRKKGYAYMQELRREGKRVEHFLLSPKDTSPREYAKEKNIKEVVVIDS